MMTILDLDDDSLMNIFAFLSIYELIEVEKVCQVFKAICDEVYCSKRFQKVRIELLHLRTEYLKDIFDRTGKTIRAFEFSGGYIMNENVKQTMIKGVANSCPKLKRLKVNYVQFTSRNFYQLQSCFCNLTHLDLSRCSIDETSLGITLDGDRFKSIKTLKLAGNSCMTGSFFQGMKQVESLDVSYCFNLSYFEFLKFLKNCINLVKLNVSASCQLVSEDENFLKIILIHQPNIETLMMDNTGLTKDDETLAQFKSLKYSSFAGRKFGT